MSCTMEAVPRRSLHVMVRVDLRRFQGVEPAGREQWADRHVEAITDVVA